MRYLDATAIDRLLDYPGLIAALRRAHLADAMPQSSVVVLDETPDSVNKFVSLVAWLPEKAIAAKLVGVFPHNLELSPAQPSVQGILVLFDGATGAPVLACDGSALTFRKTAADSALGAAYLARHDARTLLVVGAGGLAPHVIMAHTSVRPGISRVIVWNRNPHRARRLLDRPGIGGVAIEVAVDLDTAVAEADVISCVTMATAPLVRGALLRPGTHVDLIGAYLPTMREADDETLRRASLFVDTRQNCTGSGDISQPLERGLITLDSIKADLFDLCSGRHPGRSSEDEITVFKNVGGAHLDLFSIRHLAEVAAAEAAGG